MLDKQEVKQKTLPLKSQGRQAGNVYTQKRGKRQEGGSPRQPENTELRETGVLSEAILMQSFESMIEKLDGKKEARKQARRNVVGEGEKCFMADIFAKRLERARRGKFTFLLIGRTGVGRANPVNALLGKDCVPGDEQMYDSLQVVTYEHKTAEGRFSIIDTPGLCETPAEPLKDYVYLTRLEDGAPRFDGLWFVTSLLEAGITDGERHAIELITSAYGSSAWHYALIVLTHSDSIEPGIAYQKLYQEKTECIRQEIARQAGEMIATEIPSVVVASTAEASPNRKEWLSDLYLTVSMRMSDQGYLSFLLTTARRLNFSLLKSGRRVAQSIRINSPVASSTYTAAAVVKEHEDSIYIDEERGHKIEQRMQDYLINVNNRSSQTFKK